jgi:AcrR family transcriptional regulator
MNIEMSNENSGGKRARTRQTLMAAALAVAEEKGFLAASLDDIARRAGMTKGAIYSNFSGKADLMACAAESQALTLRPDYVPGAPMAAQMRALARAVVALLPQASGRARLNAQFQIYALTEPELRMRVAQAHTALFDHFADLAEAGYGEVLAISPRAFAVAAQSLSLGFIHQHQLTPDEVTEAVVTAAFEALAEGALRR